jgi:signal transduction histidine kinase
VWRALRVLGPLFLVVLQVAGSIGAAHTQPSRRPVDAVAVALLVAGPLALLWVGRRPREVVVLVGAVTATYLGLGYPYGPVFVSLAIALVVAVVRGHRVTAWVVAGGVLIVDAVTAAAFHPDRWSWASAAGVLAWCVVILALAEVGRVRAERAASYRAAARESRLRRAGEERLRIAQELHDVVAHHMSLINVQAGVALHLADRRPEQVVPALVAIRDSSKEALAELRSLIDVLRADDAPAPRRPAASLDALDDLVERSRHAGLEVAVAVTGHRRPLPAAVELAAYRVVQEAVTNIVRHAHARHAWVTLDHGDDLLVVAVEDDGTGAATAPNLLRGNGINGMYERAHALGGELEVGAGARGGLRVVARLPWRSP